MLFLLPAIACAFTTVAPRTRAVRMTMEKPAVAPSAATDVMEKIEVSEAADAVAALMEKPIGDKSFARGGDLLSMGKKATAREIVNVLGRWQKFEDWNKAGVCAEMDAMFTEAGEVQDGPALQAAWVRWDAFNDWSRVCDFSNGPNSDNIVLSNAGTSSTLDFGIFHGNSVVGVGSSDALVTGVWTHVVGTIGGSAMKVYKDGVVTT